MAVYFETEDGAAIDVGDPGLGRIDVYRGVAGHTRLVGRDIGRVLEDVTALALLQGARGPVHRLGALTVAQARQLLPALQRAAILAASGSNAYEVLCDDEDGDVTTPRWCTVCGDGAIYSTQECRTPSRPDASCGRTDWCGQHGHIWFADRPPLPVPMRNGAG